MKAVFFSIIWVAYYTACGGLGPQLVPDHYNFMVYFNSHVRAMCHGFMVNNHAVLTVAICLVRAETRWVETRPLQISVGSNYRHARQGLRIQVATTVIPKLPNKTGDMLYMLQKSPALLILEKKVPSTVLQNPLTVPKIDWKGESTITLQQDCVAFAWHFHTKDDVIYPPLNFYLPKKLRFLIMQVSVSKLLCEELLTNFRETMRGSSYMGQFTNHDKICVRHMDRIAQLCHGAYGSPLFCNGQVVGLLNAPDAQWINCTGKSNTFFLLSSDYLRDFFGCVEPYLTGTFQIDLQSLKEETYDYKTSNFDYIPDLYQSMEFKSKERESKGW